jgi:hypothetical protein
MMVPVSIGSEKIHCGTNEFGANFPSSNDTLCFFLQEANHLLNQTVLACQTLNGQHYKALHWEKQVLSL